LAAHRVALGSWRLGCPRSPRHGHPLDNIPACKHTRAKFPTFDIRIDPPLVANLECIPRLPPQAPPLPDVEGMGPQVGDVVPSFSLPDQTGAARDIDSLMGPNGLMLVFSRSADW